jgi:hypothetical protein
MSSGTRLTCPHCGRKSRTSKPLPEEVKVRCPGCGNVFAYTQPESISLVQQAEESPARLRPSTVRHEVVQVENEHAPAVQMVQANLPEPRKGNSLAIAALVLGILATLICCIPFLGLLALPVGALGLLLGVIGSLVAIIGKRSGLAASIVGTGISLGAIVLSFAITGTTSKAISDALKTESGPVAQASSPRMDTSSKESLGESMQQMAVNMTDEQKKQLTADFMTLTMPELMKTAFQSAFSKESPRAPDETEMLKPLHGLTADEIHARAEEVRRNMATERAKEKPEVQAVKKDRSAIVQKAAEAMRKAAAESFGTAESKEAQIKADQSGIKDYGDEKWEVTGQYVGSDKEGKKFRASWTATISVMFGTLQCEQLKLGDRHYESTASKDRESAALNAKAGFPSIAGVWQEGPEKNRIQVTVTQNADKFTATCTYQDKEYGRISWRMTGTISKEGEIKGSLVHTKAPRGWLNQTRTGKFSAADGTITGHDTFEGGGQDFEWKRLDD